MIKQLRRELENVRKYWRQRRRYRSIRTVCLFIGYPRSGHSLVAHLLNNHPNIVIAHENDWSVKLHDDIQRWKKSQHTARWYRGDHFREQAMLQGTMYGLFDSVIWHAAGRFRDGELKTGGYSHRYFAQQSPLEKKMLVIGDKRDSIHLQTQSLKGLKHLAFVSSRLHLIHVIRNPFDIIATICIRAMHRYGEPGQDRHLTTAKMKVAQLKDDLNASFEPSKLAQLKAHHLELAIKDFFAYADDVAEAKELELAPVADVHLAEFLDKPHQEVARLVSFLGLTADQSYLEQCAAQMKPLQRSRALFPDLFSAERIQELEARFQDYSWLRRYRYND